MHVRPGILYAVPDLIRVVDEHSLDRDHLLTDFPRFGETSTAPILDTAIGAKWILEDKNGHLSVTDRGDELTRIPRLQIVMRIQLRDIVTNIRPPWASRIVLGREELLKTSEEDVIQCFKEANLLHGFDEDVIQTLDAMQIAMRHDEDAEHIITGRLGERYSWCYEKVRTGVEPKWVAIESNKAGYDILSIVGPGSSKRMPIEVKASKSCPHEAYINLSRKGWESGENSRIFMYHLWCVGKEVKLYRVPHEEVTKHVPADNGVGKWHRTRIPFSAFEKFETEVPGEVLDMVVPSSKI